MMSGNMPSKKEIDNWFTYAFGHAPKDDYYIKEWYARFESPVRVWSYSDLKRRSALKKKFPKTFSGLDLYANLNNSEYNDKYESW